MSDRQDTIPSNVGHVAAIGNVFMNAIGIQLSSSQEQEGDDNLNQARDLVTSEIRSMVGEDDLRVIQEEIT
jgi:hypothetical protein